MSANTPKNFKGMNNEQVCQYLWGTQDWIPEGHHLPMWAAYSIAMHSDCTDWLWGMAWDQLIKDCMAVNGTLE